MNHPTEQDFVDLRAAVIKNKNKRCRLVSPSSFLDCDWTTSSSATLCLLMWIISIRDVTSVHVTVRSDERNIFSLLKLAARWTDAAELRSPLTACEDEE